MNQRINLLKRNANKIYSNKVIIETYFEIFKYMDEKKLDGACHPISTLLYILLNEQNIKSELCIGEAVYPDGTCFDHSWVEIDGDVYDIAIDRSAISSPPVFQGIDLETQIQTILKYGFKSNIEDNTGAKLAKTLSFNKWMDGYPHHEKGLWCVVKDLGNNLGLMIDLIAIKDKYKNTLRKEC